MSLAGCWYNFLIFPSVCKTNYNKFEVTEDEANCDIVKEKKCSLDQRGKEWCTDIPRQMCSKSSVTKEKVVPKTECRSLPKEICGPKNCPIIKGDRRCWNKTRHVSEKEKRNYVAKLGKS